MAYLLYQLKAIPEVGEESGVYFIFSWRIPYFAIHGGLKEARSTRSAPGSL